MDEANTPTTVDVQEPHGDVSAFFDRPNPTPRRRKPMEQLLAELAQRNGTPVFRVQPFSYAVIHANTRAAKS